MGMKLKDWLDFKRISVAKFCKYNDFCEESIYSYIKGSIPRSNIAMKIVRATGGEVSYEDLCLPEEIIAKIKLKEKKAREKREKEKARRAAKSQVSESLQLASNDVSS